MEVSEAQRGGRYPVILSAVKARYPYSAARKARGLERSDKTGRARFSTGIEAVTGTGTAVTHGYTIS